MIRNIKIESSGPQTTVVYINGEKVNGVEMVTFEASTKDFPRVTLRFHITGEQHD